MTPEERALQIAPEGCDGKHPKGGCLFEQIRDAICEALREERGFRAGIAEDGVWTSVKDELPEVVHKDGNCNAVLVWWAEENVGGFQYGISNTEYVNKYPETIICWASLPPPPKELA